MLVVTTVVERFDFEGPKKGINVSHQEDSRPSRPSRRFRPSPHSQGMNLGDGKCNDLSRREWYRIVSYIIHVLYSVNQIQY